MVFGTVALRIKTDKGVPDSSEIVIHKSQWLQLTLYDTLSEYCNEVKLIKS